MQHLPKIWEGGKHNIHQANRKYKSNLRKYFPDVLTSEGFIPKCENNGKGFWLTLSRGRSFELTSDRQQCHVSNESGVRVYEGRAVSQHLGDAQVSTPVKRISKSFVNKSIHLGNVYFSFKALITNAYFCKWYLYTEVCPSNIHELGVFTSSISECNLLEIESLRK